MRARGEGQDPALGADLREAAAQIREMPPCLGEIGGRRRGHLNLALELLALGVVEAARTAAWKARRPARGVPRVRASARKNSSSMPNL